MCVLQTLYCGNVVGDQLVQVTGAGVRLLAASSGTLLDQWTPPEGLLVNTASASPSQVQLLLLGLSYNVMRKLSSSIKQWRNERVLCPQKPMLYQRCGVCYHYHIVTM